MTDKAKRDPLTDGLDSEDAERCVLASMMRSQEAIADVAGMLTAEDFRTDAHQRIFAAIIELWDGHKVVDTTTLTNRLMRRGELADVGGVVYLGELLTATYTAGAAEYYAEIVKDQSIQRRLIHVGREIVDKASRPVDSVQAILEEAERSVLAIADSGAGRQTIEMPQAMMEAFDAIDEMHERKQKLGMALRGVGSPWFDVDEITSGWQDGELIVVAARPSVGKTAFGIGIVQHASVNLGVPTLLVSLEQSKLEIAQRLLCIQGRIDSHKLRTSSLSTEEYQQLCSAGDEIRKSPILIDDTPALNMMRLAAIARRYKARKNIGLLVVDYLQLIDSETVNKHTTRQEQVSGVSRRLKHLARELGIPVVALAQVNRQSEARTDKRLRLSDLRESGAIEQDADVVLMLNRNDEEEESRVVQSIVVDVAKQRNGPTGDVTLVFRRSCMRFENFSDDDNRAKSAG